MSMRLFLRSPRWLAAHAGIALVAAICVGFGLWQLDRHGQRQAHNAVVLERTAAAPVALSEILEAGEDPADREGVRAGSLAGGPFPEEAAYRRVTVEGRYDPHRELLLYGRGFAGRPGHRVLTPLRTGAGPAVLVDRGWVPPTVGGPPVESAPPPPGPVRVSGVLLPPETAAGFGSGDPQGPGRATVVRVDLEGVAADLPYPLHTAWLALESQTPPQQSELPIPAGLPPPDAGPHLAYAGQWFLFAAVALGGYAAVLRRAVRGGHPGGWAPAGLARGEDVGGRPSNGKRPAVNR